MEIEEDSLALDLEEIERKFPENPLEFFRDKRLCLFNACLERYYPGVRWGIQDLLADLNIDAPTCTNQSCCSGTFFQRNLITRAQFAAINERNLNEMNQQADIVLVPCNGCYNSLLRGRDFLKSNEVKTKTQEILSQLNTTFKEGNYPGKYEILEKPNLKLVHDLDFLYLIRNDVVNSLKFDLKGFKVAVHYGCHYLNLSRDKKTPESLLKDKTKLEELISLFGGEPVDYQERELCCGWGASQRIINLPESLYTTYRKLKSVQNVGADFILVPCPTCLYSLEKPEYRKGIANLYNEQFDIPVIHLNELIAMLRGCEEERCITLRRKTPRLEEIFESVTKE